MTSNFYDFASRGFTETIRSKKPVFSEKICIKECLEVGETQVVCCGHPQNIYFMLNSTTMFHCAIIAGEDDENAQTQFSRLLGGALAKVQWSQLFFDRSYLFGKKSK